MTVTEFFFELHLWINSGVGLLSENFKIWMRMMKCFF